MHKRNAYLGTRLWRMEAIQPRICIQPQSRRSPRYYITIIIRAPSRVFQFQDSQHSFQDDMDYRLPGLHWKRFTTPCRRQHHCSLHRCGFSLLNCIYLQVFCLHYIFWPDRIFISAGRTVNFKQKHNAIPPTSWTEKWSGVMSIWRNWRVLR